LYSEGYRGFESLFLRQFNLLIPLGIFWATVTVCCDMPMERRLALYRRHAALCVHGYATDFRIYDPELPEHDPRYIVCTCPIVASGKLKLEEGRAPHRSTASKEWVETRRIRGLWLTWGQSTEPIDPLITTTRNTISIDEAIRFFVDFGHSTNTKGHSTDEKLGSSLGAGADRVPEESMR
jgi:hypothetical protein